MTDVRNQRLAHFVSSGTGIADVFHCPDANVILVKSAYLANQSGVAAAYTVYAETSKGQLPLVLGDLAIAQLARWDGMLAMNPGDKISMWTDQAGIMAWFSGAILAGGPPWPVLPPLGDTFTPGPPPQWSSPLGGATAQDG